MDETTVQLILQEQQLAYAITDQDLQVLAVQDSEGLLAPMAEQALGRALPDLVPELIGSEAVLADIVAGELPRFELAWVNRETDAGQTRYLTMVDLPHRDEKRRIVGLIHLVQDVTEMGTLQQELAQSRNELRLLRDQLARQNLDLAAANAELQQLAEMKSVFVSVAAHELRTPLTAISGYVELVLDETVGPLTDKQRKYLQTVQASASRLLDITSNLLDVTRIETGRIELMLQPMDLSAIVETVAAEYVPQREAKAQHLKLSAQPGLPPALCDETRAAQIIGNLLSNAMKYTPEAGTIALSVTADTTAGFLRVSVQDDGVGIPADEQDKLFRRFFRASTAPLTGASGAGLGLHIVKSLAELHGGQIWLESEPGAGSTFHVTFPIADASAPYASGAGSG